MRVVLDACVLYPTVLRELLIGCASAGMFEPVWSSRILEEWRRAVIRNQSGQTEGAAVDIALLRARFRDAEVPQDADLENRLSLPDPDDRHVLATAITGRAEVIATLNLRDFPTRRLADHRIYPRHPDVILLDLLTQNREVLEALTDRVTSPLLAAGAFPTRRALLRRAQLPRFGKGLDHP